MNEADLIKKYFSDHPDKDFNNEYRNYGGFFCEQRNSIYLVQKLSKDKIKILYKIKSELRNQPIIENGQTVGHIRFANPHTIITRNGSFILQGVKKVKRKEPISHRRLNAVKIRRSFWPWSKTLIVNIKTDFLNVLIKCNSIIPNTYYKETINLKKPPEVLPPPPEFLPPDDLFFTPPEELFTRYSPHSKFNQKSPWEYPVVKIPEKGCIVRSYREGSTKRRGYKDADFENALANFLGKALSISGNVRLNTGKDIRPYEPDIAIIDKDSGLNIRIDIEIDEPYAGITRQATHCIGEDDLRDLYFVERGWIVIRFTEYQVHMQEKECLAFVAQLIQSINPSFKIPTALQGIGSPVSETQWDLIQAQKWESIGWREEYLEHIFRPTPVVPETTETELNDQEKSEEEHVKHSVLGEIEALVKVSFNERNTHARDKRIRFYPEPHIYEIDGVPAHSASTIVSRFFPEFDVPYWSRKKAIEQIEDEGGELTESNIQRVASVIAERWKANGEAASRDGTYLHQQIEHYFLQKPYDQPPEFQLFLQFNEQHQDLQPYRTEWRIFDERKLVAGTVDLIVRNGNGFDLYDWKRSKKLISSIDGRVIIDNQYQQGIGQLSNIDDRSFNRYAIQQNIYRHILETKYGLTINNMYLVVIHPNYDTFHKLPVERMQDEIDYIFRTI